MIRTFLYTISVSLALLSAFSLQAQVKPASPAGDTIRLTKPAQDSTLRRQATPSRKQDSTAARKQARSTPPVTRLPDSVYYVPGGLRIGVDISRFALLYFQPYRTDVTFQADARINKKFYGAIEMGYNRTSHSDTSYTYKGNGMYATIGVDYDFLKKRDKDEKNMVFAGIRYGFARNTYEVPKYRIISDYWGSDITGSYPKTNMTAHWIELCMGIRVEALKNFFLGWGIREKIMLSSSADDAFPPIVIPGFGSGNKRSQFDMTYTVSYYFPLYKLKISESREPRKKKD